MPTPSPLPSPPTLLLLLTSGGLFVACDVGYTAEGAWEGDCTIDEHDGASVVTFRLEILEPEAGQIEGDGTFKYRDRDYRGYIHGERYAEEVELTIDGSGDDGHGTRLEIEGELEGDRLLGECSLYGVEGRLTMSRRP